MLTLGGLLMGPAESLFLTAPIVGVMIRLYGYPTVFLAGTSQGQTASVFLPPAMWNAVLTILKAGMK